MRPLVLVSEWLERYFTWLGGVVKELCLVRLVFCDYLDICLYFNRYEILLSNI